MPHVYVATEDELSEAVAVVLATEAGLDIVQRLRRGGFGYLKSNVGKFCQLARTYPVIVLTDLDTARCAPQLVATWLDRHAAPANFLLRVAVREIESWLLADHVAMRSLLGKRNASLPRVPDSLRNPKRELLTLAAGASRVIRDELLAGKGAVASQGLGYNAVLCEWVRTTWSAERASVLSPSLARTRLRLDELSRRLIE